MVLCGYAVHTWNRHAHRKALGGRFASSIRLGATSLDKLSELNMPMTDLLTKINSLLQEIDQILIPSTLNNFINTRFILKTERDIINIFEEAQPKALNYLVDHSKLGLLFYKIKDHRRFNHRHRTQLIELLAIDRVSQLTVHSKVIVLHSLQMMKLPANTKAEHWVRNIILATKQDELSELKTQADGRGNWYCMSKLLYDDIRSVVVREDILRHIQREARVVEAHRKMKTKKSRRDAGRRAWRKILSDVDDTLSCSGGHYPAGIDRRYGKKVVYPGVLAFYRELDLGTDGPDEWPSNAIGNLVFLSARPHLYKDVTEKHNFAKFQKLRNRTSADGRGGVGMHTIPSILSGDLTSGTQFILKNDYEPLAQKKFENFQKYISIYPEYKHVFVCDNGQGDVRASEMMVDSFPDQVEAIYVHAVQAVDKTYKYNAERWKAQQEQQQKGRVNMPFFFTTYPEAALDAVQRNPPLIAVAGLRRICQDSVNDFYMIQTKDWPSQKHKWDRRDELNQALYRCNRYLETCGQDTVPLLEGERLWRDCQRVSTPYGNGIILSFDAVFDLYEVKLDWRPLDVQVAESERYQSEEKIKKVSEVVPPVATGITMDSGRPPILETVEEVDEDAMESISSSLHLAATGSSSGGGGGGEGGDGSCSLCSETPVGEETGESESLFTKNHETLPTKTLDIGNAIACTSSITTGIKIKSSLSVNEGVGEGALQDEALSVSAGVPTESSSYAGEKQSESSAKHSKINDQFHHPVTLRIQGRYLTKFIFPSLPIFPKDDENSAVFSFYYSSANTKQDTPKFSKGVNCSTPYGSGCISEYRETDGIVVVAFTRWSAQAYLNKDVVKSEGSFFGNFIRQMTGETSEKALLSQPQLKEVVEFTYVTGSIVQTPFGEGKIFRSLQAKYTDNAISLSSSSQGAISDIATPQNETIGLDITSWILADDSHPKLYCTVEVAVQWQKIAEDKTRSNASGIFSTFGSYISQGMKILMDTSNNKKIPTTKVPSEILVQTFARYYKDGAVVTTPFGEGSVRSFRESDGIYEVALLKWKMKGELLPTIFLTKDALSNYVSNGCHEGYPVLTSLGVSGNLASVQPTTGIHIVTVPMAGMVCYLQPQNILRPLKAATTEDVLTQYGEGKVDKYRLEDDIYEISLHGNAKLYAKAEAFDRVSDGLEDQGLHSLGMKWLLRFLFGSRKNEDGDGSSCQISRSSRSNSIVSLSARSQNR